jgi:hypothetical protein
MRGEPVNRLPLQPVPRQREPRQPVLRRPRLRSRNSLAVLPLRSLLVEGRFPGLPSGCVGSSGATVAVGGDQEASTMTKSLFAIALGAGLLLTASSGASAQEGFGIFDTERDCTADVQSLCGGVKPGHGHVMACLQAHVGELSVGCSTILSKAMWVSRECAADIHQFCPGATFGSLSGCMQPHLGDVSGTCQSALAYIASPAGDRY